MLKFPLSILPCTNVKTGDFIYLFIYLRLIWLMLKVFNKYLEQAEDYIKLKVRKWDGVAVKLSQNFNSPIAAAIVGITELWKPPVGQELDLLRKIWMEWSNQTIINVVAVVAWKWRWKHVIWMNIQHRLLCLCFISKDYGVSSYHFPSCWSRWLRVWGWVLYATAGRI